jgi:hypothetical protein
MNKKREKLKLRRKKTERKDSVCRKSSVARSSFTIGIGHGDLLRAGSQRRNSNGQRVGVFESNGCWFSANGNGSAVDETAAANREYCATSGRDRRGLNRADAKRYGRKLPRAEMQAESTAETR